MTIPTNERFRNVEQLASEFMLNELTVRNWIRTGVLKTIKLGDRHRIYESQWQDFLEKCNEK